MFTTQEYVTMVLAGSAVVLSVGLLRYCIIKLNNIDFVPAPARNQHQRKEPPKRTAPEEAFFAALEEFNAITRKADVHGIDVLGSPTHPEPCFVIMYPGDAVPRKVHSMSRYHHGDVRREIKDLYVAALRDSERLPETENCLNELLAK